MSESKHVYACMAGVQSDLAEQGIEKASENTFDRYNFRGIDDVLNAMAPLLAKHGLLIVPHLTHIDQEVRQSSQGKPQMHTQVVVAYDFIAMDDCSIYKCKGFPGEAMDRGDKGVQKAMTAAYKYMLFETFCIPVQGTDDADRHSPQLEDVAQPTPIPEPPPPQATEPDNYVPMDAGDAQALLDGLKVLLPAADTKEKLRSLWQGNSEELSRLKRDHPLVRDAVDELFKDRSAAIDATTVEDYPEAAHGK